MQALHYVHLEDEKVKCELCPHNCIISKDKSGICKVRTNINGELISRNYGLVSSIGFDPIEKKPLYHFYPGSEILSVGSLGCNLQCKFCQNWQISQTGVDEFSRTSPFYKSDQVIELALNNKRNIGIAYTYNEPTVFYEYMFDTAKLAKENKLMNVMVTNGFINQKPLQELIQYMDAFSVDLKAFNEDFFRTYTKSALDPVKETLKTIVQAGKHLEITNLVIPSLNDDANEFENMVKWIEQDLGKNIVFHISRYFPMYKLKIEATSVKKMAQFYQIAKSYLNYVYLGNIVLTEGNNTYCPECGEIIIERIGYSSISKSINSQGNCLKCGNHILKYIHKQNEN